MHVIWVYHCFSIVIQNFVGIKWIEIYWKVEKLNVKKDWKKVYVGKIERNSNRKKEWEDIQKKLKLRESERNSVKRKYKKEIKSAS